MENNQPDDQISDPLYKSAEIHPISSEGVELAPVDVEFGRGKNGNVSLRSQRSTAARGDFSMFRTKSTLSRQASLLPLRNNHNHNQNQSHNINQDRNTGVESQLPQDDPVSEPVSAGRYFRALSGPELNQIRDSEELLLPKNETWPFLLRFPIGCFGMCLGLSSQAILWRQLATSPVTGFLKISPNISLVIWFLSLALLASIAIVYSLKIIYFMEAVRREYFHPVRINFFFAPWIICMFLSLGFPPEFNPGNKIHPSVWCIFVFPLILLELKIYGQWLSGGKRRLCKVANPSTHLSIVGNFVASTLAAKVGWKEPAKFMWAVGLAHYLVLFVTLYQRLPTNETLPKDLHPVYSMFIAAPSAASIAWEVIQGKFDDVSRLCYFTALFLYSSLIVRITFFIGFKFSISWWAYTFPMTTAAIATISYARAEPSFITKTLVIVLSAMSTIMVLVIFVSTFLHAFVWGSLFPNDPAIAIIGVKTETSMAAAGAKHSEHAPKKDEDKTA